MKYINFKNKSISTLALKFGEKQPGPDLLSHAYLKGIKLFDTYTKYPETISAIGDWVASTDCKDVVISLHSKYTDNHYDRANECRDKLNTSNIIYHLSHIETYDTEMDKILQDLFLMEQQKGILSYGIRTHVAKVASSFLLKNIKSIQLPVNAVEYSLYMSLKDLISETGALLMAFNIIGDGNRHTVMYPEDLLIYSVMSLIQDNIMVMEADTVEDIDRIVKTVEEYNGAVYPLIQDFCTKCQKCEEVCMNHYPLARYIKYCKSIEAPVTKEWGQNKLREEQVEFDCINCNLCEDACPMKLPIKQYIKSHLEMLS